MLAIKFLWSKNKNYLLFFKCLLDYNYNISCLLIHKNTLEFKVLCLAGTWFETSETRRLTSMSISAKWSLLWFLLMTSVKVLRKVKQRVLALEFNKQEFVWFNLMFSCSLPIRRNVIVAIFIIMLIILILISFWRDVVFFMQVYKSIKTLDR